MSWGVRWQGQLAHAQTQATSLPPYLRLVTEGSGPMQKVTRIEQVPGAVLRPLGSVTALAAELNAGNSAAASTALVNTGIGLFGDGLGATSSAGTMLEHGLMVNGLSSLNTAFAWAGLVTTLVSASNDQAQGNPTAAGAGALKGAMSFAISNWGWGAVQVGGVSLFFLDIALREWAGATLSAGLDNFRAVYRESFRDDPRGVNDWKRIAWDIYLQAEAKTAASHDAAANAFGTMLSAEVKRYTDRKFTPEMLLNWDKSTAGLGMFGDQARVEEALAKEYQTEIEAMLLKQVYPEIARRAGERNIKQMVARLNAELRPDLNREVLLEVTAWGLAAPADVVVPLADGTAWSGRTDAAGTFRMTFTRLAFLKGGLPGKVLLRHDGQEEAREVRIVGDRMTAIFGEPTAAIITRFRLQEAPRSCVMTRRDAQTGAVLERRSMGLPALAESLLDMAVLPSGAIIAGSYDPATGAWRDASPGQVRDNRDLVFGPPYYTGLDKLSDCSFDLLTSAGKLSAGQCRFWRRAEKTKGTEQLELRCDSPGKADLVGIFADAKVTGTGGQGMTYFPMDGAAGKALVDTLRLGMEKGAKGFDPSMLKGISP